MTVDGVMIGSVISTPAERLTRDADINFEHQQSRTSWIITAFTALLAAAVTWVLSRGMLAPVKRLVNGTHQLAAGDFSTRVEVDSEDELGKLAQDFNQLAMTLEKTSRCAAPLWLIFPTNCARRWRCYAASWKRCRTACAK